MTELRCLQDYGDRTCDGPVERRYALSPTGVRHPRCDRHWATRLVEQERINNEYGGVIAPSTFDPGYAGETW